ncbi:hypothetical protein [Rhodoferax sp.]|nr:hypothetical protein [Rhodoferax sp.]
MRHHSAPRRNHLLPWLAVTLALVQGMGELLALQRTRLPRPRR